MKVKLLQQAMGQSIGAEMEVSVEVARLLIGRGAAEAIEPEKEQPKYPERNKSLSARQPVKG